jgi:mitochondrial fission protein ELM1
MTGYQKLLILSDGKPGHRNQSLGLAEALLRQIPGHIDVIDITSRNPFRASAEAIRKARLLTRPHLIIAAGQATHAALLVLGKKLDAPTVVLMRPSLPCALFDLCLIPQHDLRHSDQPSYIIPTIGALNRIQANPEPSNRGLIMIGGASKEFTWDGESLISAISEIIANSSRDWHLTDSRRTPPGFVESIRSLPITIHPHQETSPDWLPSQLADVDQAWVTQDSVSMIFEALSSSASVGILPLLPRKNLSKISRAVQQLCEDQQASFFSDWQKCHQLPSAAPLREADRCAKLVLQSLHHHLL